MKNTLKLEEIGMFIFSIYLFMQLEYSWWLYPALFFLPDIGMIGYLINSKIGADLYNLFHHKGVAILVLIAGYTFNLAVLQLAGIILFGHSSFDRVLGYGLKYPDGFKNTHLGTIGKDSELDNRPV